MSEHNGDIKKFLQYLNEEYYHDNDIDYSFLVEDKEENEKNCYRADIFEAIRKLNSYESDNDSYEFRSGVQAGLIFAVEILENILDKNNPGE